MVHNWHGMCFIHASSLPRDVSFQNIKPHLSANKKLHSIITRNGTIKDFIMELRLKKTKNNNNELIMVKCNYRDSRQHPCMNDLKNMSMQLMYSGMI